MAILNSQRLAYIADGEIDLEQVGLKQMPSRVFYRS